MDPLLNIGVFARRSRLSMKALRLYDRLGLLPPAKVDSGNGYRWYRESQLDTARLVVMLRRLDMPLAEVAEVVSMPDELGASRLAAYWEGVERRFAGQRELAAYLQGKLLGKEGTMGIFEVRERSVPEQVVLTEQRHTLVDQLSCWIGMAMPRLMSSAGRDHGNPFVVYYGVVDEDNDGPVEICVPVDPSMAGAADLATRREPAHREVYVRLRKAQVEFPQIFSAYDCVASWISTHGLVVDGSPREVYFADYGSAAPDDEVCDVAYPIA